ncbi:efflux RND transporter periplasmic adaptor subunit [Oceanisphaera sediminis]|uniref:efflux RND transporter periplasmic adaptor subunit n=1 Tax=Oceanisphaera sediminis TaxID=981381 RepID=UPI0031EF6936
MASRQSRKGILLVVTLLLAGLFGYAFWPRPIPVDTGLVRRGSMMVTIDEEARTRVRERYMVSAPVAGRLLRVTLEAGDAVAAGETELARLVPAPVSLLDARAREGALAAVKAAEAAVNAARADVGRAEAASQLADAEWLRNQQLYRRGHVSASVRDQARQAAQAATATLKAANAAVVQRQAELAAARAQLGQGNPGKMAAGVPLLAPVSGRVLQRLVQSETVVAAGTAIMEIGDPERDLEVLVELPSAEAVRVAPGNRVLIDHWGGPQPLAGVVARVEPRGFTKFSALGVEEQRVNVLIRFDGEPEARRGLGHGYRVEVRIIVWQDDRALMAPSSALFREGEQWAVLVVQGNRARLTRVEVGYDNGRQAQIVAGLSEGQQLVLYPGPELADGARIAPNPVD